MAEVPPILSAIPSESTERFSKLTNAFQEKYGKPPIFARSSGRVNLIGEHIDYCGYSVLPMAIEQDIVIAAAPNDSKTINLSNIDGSFSPYSCSTQDFVIDKTKPLWFHYFLCGFKGIVEHCKLDDVKGMDLILDGTVPKSAGLSSSSALVCCAALVTMHINGQQLTKLELADICQHCERYIGTEGGGMDQAISFLAQPGTAKLIEFNPVRATDVQLPEGAVFVISNSCVEMNKAATNFFNNRVSECRLATQLIAKRKGLAWRKVCKLGELHQALGVSLEEMLSIVKEVLHAEPYSREEVCSTLGVTSDELNQISLNERSRGENLFKVYDRATHVYSEANRVIQFKAICDKKTPNALQLLGELMNSSHVSCSQVYECSCPELDNLTKLARDSGALGSRLTGAGWGGCAVSLVPTQQLESFLKKMKEGYYASDPRKIAAMETSLFATQPGGGACIYIPK